MLQRHRPPVEAGGEQIQRIHGQQTASNNSGTLSSHPAQQQEEQPDTGYAGQQNRIAQRRNPRAEDAEYRAIDPGFQGPQVAHQHERNLGMPDMEHEGRRARLVQDRGEQGFVILNAEVREEGPPREEEKDAGSPGAQAAMHSVRVRTHSVSWRIVREMVASCR